MSSEKEIKEEKLAETENIQPQDDTTATDLSNEENQIGVDIIEPPYSILTDAEKYTMVGLISISGIWSTLSSSIYFPALPILAHKFNVSSSVINISVVAYLLFQGLAPSFLAPLADTFGRRPMVIFCTISYCAVCIGLAKTNVYWLLAFLRCIQAAVIAPIIAVSSGINSDMITRRERGKFIGLTSGIQLLGQGFGALVGAALVHGFGWRGIFVALAIGSGFAGICDIFLLPETNRSIVGNGSIAPTNILNIAPILALPRYKKRMTNDISTKRERPPADVLEVYKIFLKKEVFITLLPAAFQFATWTMSLTTLSTSLEQRYGLSVIHIGLCYLAPGIGTLLGSVITGRIMDRIYKAKKAKYDIKYQDVPKEERPEFDILTTRVQFTIYPTIITIIFTIIYGWCIQKTVNLSIVLISAFIMSYCAVAYLGAMMTLLVDLFPDNGSAASGCLNLIRCLLGAAGVGALQPMVSSMGEGGCYTLMAGFCFISYGMLYFMIKSRNRKNN
ncbi:multidrug resistance transporter [Scheffersomyces coipomensis]|uniref:multidrug resistance transporter n=1 Tax=Scheffersomyces coipomensis TaxID=1788519 RepID=UPI00315D1190